MFLSYPKIKYCFEMYIIAKSEHQKQLISSNLKDMYYDDNRNAIRFTRTVTNTATDFVRNVNNL